VSDLDLLDLLVDTVKTGGAAYGDAASQVRR